MVTKIQKWGNSLGLRIPRALAEEAGLGVGCEVDLKLEDGCVIIVLRPSKRYALDDLLAGVSRKNVHGETDTGNAAGREVW